LNWGQAGREGYEGRRIRKYMDVAAAKEDRSRPDAKGTEGKGQAEFDHQ